MQQNRRPENRLERLLPRLMMKELLRHISTGPTTQQIEDMQHVFSQPPARCRCSVLVEAIETEGEDTHGCVDLQGKAVVDAEVEAKYAAERDDGC